MKFFLYFFILLCCLISFSSYTEDKIKDGTSFIISHVSHPKIDSINKIIQQVYSSLGFKVEFIPVPSRRGISLLNDGIVDADSIRMIESVKNYENILLIEPAILNLKVVLICQRGMPCSKELLKDQNVSILSDRGNIQLIGQENINANIVVNEKPRYQHVINKKHRALIPQIEKKLREVLKSTEYGKVVASKTSAINKKP